MTRREFWTRVCLGAFVGTPVAYAVIIGLFFGLGIISEGILIQ
ncbi:hypothetical protein [Ferrovibrio terrae]